MHNLREANIASVLKREQLIPSEFNLVVRIIIYVSFSLLVSILKVATVPWQDFSWHHLMSTYKFIARYLQFAINLSLN